MCTRQPNRPSTSGLTRRDMIRAGVAGTLGIATLGPLGRGILQSATGAPLPNHRRCIVIYCYGGYDGLQLLVPHGIQAYYDRRPTIAIDGGDTLDIGKTGYGLNPGLDAIHGIYQDGECAVFQKVGYPDDDLSHFESQNFYSWGVRFGFGNLPIDESGWIARFADAYTNDALGAVSVGVGRPLDMEGTQSVSPLMVSNLAGFQFYGDPDYLPNSLHRFDAVEAILDGYAGGPLDEAAKDALKQGYDLATQIQSAVTGYTPPTVDYPGSTPGRFLEDIARMIQAGFDTKVFFTGFSGWDNHSNLLTAMGNRIDRLDDAVGAFALHCKEMGIWDDTLILIESEFGRRIFENGSNGSDHGHGNCFFALGGGVKGGYFGPDLTPVELQSANWLDYEIDFRDIRKEMVNDWFGGDGGLVFPEPQEIDQTLDYL